MTFGYGYENHETKSENELDWTVPYVRTYVLNNLRSRLIHSTYVCSVCSFTSLHSVIFFQIGHPHVWKFRLCRRRRYTCGGYNRASTVILRTILVHRSSVTTWWSCNRAPCTRCVVDSSVENIWHRALTSTVPYQYLYRTVKHHTSVQYVRTSSKEKK